MKKKILLCALSFFAVALFSCGIAFLPLDAFSPSNENQETAEARNYSVEVTLGTATLTSDFLGYGGNTNADYTYTTSTGYKITVQGPRLKVHVHAGKDISKPKIDLRLTSYQTSGSASGSESGLFNNTKYQVCWDHDGSTSYYDWTIMPEPNVSVNGSNVSGNTSERYNCGSGWSWMCYNTESISSSSCSVGWSTTARQLYTTFVIIRDGQEIDRLSRFDYYREMTDHPSYPTYTGYTCQGVYAGTTTSSAKVYNTTERIVSNGGTYYVIYTKNNYYVDVNNYLDGGANDSAKPYGLSFSVKVDGVVKGTGLTDFYQGDIPYNSKVEVYDIKIGSGYSYSSYTVSPSGYEQSGSSKSHIIVTTPAEYLNIFLYFVSDPTLTINPNGGTYSGSTSIQKPNGSTQAISSPSRTGYSLGAWVLDGGGSISTFGKLHSKSADPFFMDGTNSTYVYNNSYNGTVTHEYIAASNTDIELPTGARILRIKNVGTSSPGLGGFSNHLESYAKAVIYTIIYAKIPVGYNIYSAENAFGGGTKTWLTSQAGTGDWQVYIHRYNCGSSGSFSSVNFYYLSGTAGTTSNPVVWDVAYFGTYDATGLSVSGDSTGNLTYTYDDSNNSLVALWNRSSVTVTINPDGGSYNGSTSNSSISAKYRDFINLETPTKPGYIFNGWTVSSGSGTLREAQYLLQERSFDGVDDFVAIGRDQMYTDKITVSVLAYMDNWAEYGVNDNAMRIISCTEGGGWNIESSNGNIQVVMYDSGIGYKYATASKPWSSLSAGWHDFTFSFDGRNARLFIDDAQIACSAEFTSGKIGYNSNNGIFIGAEAGSSATTPVDGYFKGKIKNVIIFNDYVLGNVYDGQSEYSIVPTGNVTLKANWIETWAVNYTVPSGSGTEEEPYQVDSANDLAYFAYKTQILGEQCFDHIVLTKDIDLSGHDWMPIGTGRNVVSGVQPYFRGVFDGQGHTISNLNINVEGYQELNEYGLFGQVNDGAIIKDFIISSGQVKGLNSDVGVVVGYLQNATIENVTNYVDVTGEDYVGGIVGSVSSGTTLDNCINNGSVSGREFVGGIAGSVAWSGATIINSTNNGSVTGTLGSIGGIAGLGLGYALIEGNTNYGDVIATEAYYVGGIVGNLSDDSSASSFNYTINENANYATVQGNNDVGGIVGSSRQNASITNNHNLGNISTSNSADSAAGIAGYFNSGSLTGNTTRGNVTGTRYVGGLVGYLQSGTFSSNQVEGVISGTANVGGIAGYVNSASSFENIGVNASVKISNLPNSNGLIGQGSNLEITNCYFIGEFTDHSGNAQNMSGFVGYGSTNAVTDSYFIANGNKTVQNTTGFEDWTIISGVNGGNPVQKELYHIAGVGGDSEKLDTWLKTNNILSDGSFEYGDWSAWTGTSELSTEHARSGNYSWKLTGESSRWETFNRTVSTYEIDSTHIYFVRMYAYQEVQTGEIQAYWQDVDPAVGNSTLGTAGQWNMYGWRFDRVGFSGSHPFRIDFDNHNQAGELWVDDVLLIDLTAMYGAGNEPSQEECMRLFA